MGWITQARTDADRRFDAQVATATWHRLQIWWPIRLGDGRKSEPLRYCTLVEYIDTSRGRLYRDCAKASDVV